MRKLIVSLVATATLVTSVIATDNYTCSIDAKADGDYKKSLGHKNLNHKGDITALKYGAGYRINGEKYEYMMDRMTDGGMMLMYLYKVPNKEKYFMLQEDILNRQIIGSVVLGNIPKGDVKEVAVFKCAKLSHEDVIVSKLNGGK